MTIELGICLSLMGAMLVALGWWHVHTGREFSLAPWPIGQVRRLCDRVRREEICAAAQAATLAGDPKFAKELLGRYGLDLCPSCTAWTPISSRMWAKRVRESEDRAAIENFDFVAVCHECFEAECPIGWTPSRKVLDYADAVIRRIEKRVDVRLHLSMERAQQRFDRMQARFQRMQRRFFHDEARDRAQPSTVRARERSASLRVSAARDPSSKRARETNRKQRSDG